MGIIGRLDRRLALPRPNSPQYCAAQARLNRVKQTDIHAGAMSAFVVYLVAAGVGFAVAHFISRAPELRTMRLSQLVLVPVLFVVAAHLIAQPRAHSQIEGMANFIAFAGVMGFLAVLLAPNIAYHCGAALSNFLDPTDWTPEEEEIALRPIQHLIDRNRYHEALTDLKLLLVTHKPTYEARLMAAKLLHHCGQLDESVSSLVSLIELSQTTPQQLAAMELLALLEEYHHEKLPSGKADTGRIQIRHELVLFPISEQAVEPYKLIAPGTHDVESLFHRNHRWLKLKGSEWGNAEMCWRSIEGSPGAPEAAPRRSVFRHVARLHQSISRCLYRKPYLRKQMEAQAMFKEAGQLMREEKWAAAAPILEKAASLDPGRYEIAYRWLQAVVSAGNSSAADCALTQILEQSQWTESEEEMLKQLRRSGVK